MTTARGETMSVAIAGKYIQELREQQELTQMDVIRRLIERFPQFRSVDTKVIWAIEKNERNVRTPLLAAIVRVLGGDGNDMLDLMLDDTLTHQDAARRAELRLAQDDVAKLYDAAQRTPSSQLGMIAKELRQIDNDPVKLAQLAGYIKGLIDA